MRHVVFLRVCIFALLSFAVAPEARAQAAASVSESADALRTDPSSLRLLTYNIRVENDAEGWKRRRDTVARVLNDDRFDVIAIQEANEMMIADYQAMLPNYYYLVGERSDGHRGDQKWYEFNPIFYNPKRFEKIDSGSIWVGEDPAKPGDTLLNSKWHGRVFTWMILRERTTGRRLAFGNVHVHGGRGEDAVRLVAKTLRARAGGAPIVLLGDFNSAPDSEAYHRLTDPKDLGLNDSLAVANERSGGDVTILDGAQSVPSGATGVKTGGQAKRIDYIFADPAWSVRSYRVIDSRISGETFASDHFPVAVTLRLADQAAPLATVQSQLSPGVTYQKIVVPGDAPMVAHVVSVDLQHPGLRFAVTPADRSAGGETRAQLTSEYLRASRALVAVNGSYFLPFASGTSGGDDYYPHVGELADASGAVLSGGRTVSPPETALDIRINAMVCFRGLKVTIVDGQRCPAGATDGLAAGPRLLAGGQKRPFLAFDNRYAVLPAPRTAIGVSADGKKAWIVVVDGRQSKYSVGASLDGLTKLFSELGASDAINLDGGGSSTLVTRSPDGRPLVLNRPIHTDTPGRERPVANAILLLGK